MSERKGNSSPRAKVIKTHLVENTPIYIDSPFASIWIAKESVSSMDYFYGGTRIVYYDTSASIVLKLLNRLMLYESSLKNRLINKALEAGALDTFVDRLPIGFLQSRVGGARCLIRPKDKETFDILTDPDHSEFDITISQVMKSIGNVLNQNKGEIKLTPDFGHYAKVSDILAEYTEHVLGINCDKGGCGGKTSYSSTGVVAAFEAIGGPKDTNIPVTLLGAAGAVGTDILDFLLKTKFTDIALCDIVYEADKKELQRNLLVLPAQFGTFTSACLERGGVILATTVGHELENAPIENIPTGTKLILAHNLAIPIGEEGILLTKKLQNRGILALPGQLVTLGGALTSRLEWFWRQAYSQKPFDKKLAHAIVRETVTFLVNKVLHLAEENSSSPYEAMLQYTNFL
jgi:hypothetical protein